VLVDLSAVDVDIKHVISISHTYAGCVVYLSHTPDNCNVSSFLLHHLRSCWGSSCSRYKAVRIPSSSLLRSALIIRSPFIPGGPANPLPIVIQTNAEDLAFWIEGKMKTWIDQGLPGTGHEMGAAFVSDPQHNRLRHVMEYKFNTFYCVVIGKYKGIFTNR
jgi:hypothetical protein